MRVWFGSASNLVSPFLRRLSRREEWLRKNLANILQSSSRASASEEELFLGLGSWWPLTIAAVRRPETDLHLPRRAREDISIPHVQEFSS